MSIDPQAIGAELGRSTVSWTSRDTLLYALGVGAGTAELEFTTENSHGVEQRVLPTFAVIIAKPPLDLRRVGDLDSSRVLHGSQSVTIHRSIPTAGAASVVTTVTDIQDKGTGGHAFISAAAVASDDSTGEQLVTCESTIVYRGGGGFGGDRGSARPVDPIPSWRKPEFRFSGQTSKSQALLYRLSGDRNPLHSDPWFATERSGFPQPILHGLCTYGFAGRALLHTVCRGDVAAFGAMTARFTSPVFPGQLLTTEVWLTEQGAVFRTLAGPGGPVVLDNGIFTHADSC